MQRQEGWGWVFMHEALVSIPCATKLNKSQENHSAEEHVSVQGSGQFFSVCYGGASALSMRKATVGASRLHMAVVIHQIRPIAGSAWQHLDLFNTSP
jgi:hypothetical protein